MKENIFHKLFLVGITLMLTASLALAGCAGPATPAETKAPAVTEVPATEVPAEAPTEIIATEAPATTEAPVTTEAPAAEEKTLTIAVSGDISGWDPVSSIYWLANEVIINTHDTLVEFGEGTDAQGNPVRDITKITPRLAESWDVSEDGKTFTFHLRKNAKFNNGDPVTASAVKASFERILNNPGLAQFLLKDIAFVTDPNQMVVEDDYTLTFNLPQPNPIFLKVMYEMNMAVVNVAQIQKEGGATAEEQNEWAANHPTGSGPYVLESFEPGVQLVLKANPYYWGEPPEFTKIVYKIVPEPQNRILLLKNGDVDIVYEIPLKDFADLKADPNIQAYAIPTLGTLYMLLGRNGEPWSNVKLRQAICYAIPYDTIIQEVTYGLAIPAPSWLPVGLEGFIPASPYTYDLEKAKALLEEAGYPNGQGLPPITFYLKQGVPEEEEAAVYIQAELAKIGIQMDIQPLALSAHSEKLASHEKGLFSFQFWIPYVPDPVYSLYWNYKTAESGCCNYSSYSVPEVDDLITKALTEFDPEIRRGYVEEIQKLIAEDPPQIALYHPTWNLAMRAGLTGYSYYPDTLLRFVYFKEK